VAIDSAFRGRIEDFSLIVFETLAVEDKHSMLHLTHAKIPTGAADQEGEKSGAERANAYALMASAAEELSGRRGDVRDVQERWIDARDEWDA